MNLTGKQAREWPFLTLVTGVGEFLQGYETFKKNFYEVQNYFAFH